MKQFHHLFDREQEKDVPTLTYIIDIWGDIIRLTTAYVNRT